MILSGLNKEILNDTKIVTTKKQILIGIMIDLTKINI